MADRPTLRDLRKLAKEAGLTLVEQGGDRMRWHCSAYSEGMTIKTRDGSKMEARRQLRQLLQDIATGRRLREEDSNGCPP